MRLSKILFVLLFVLTNAAFAQKNGKYDLRFNVKSIDCTNKKVQIELLVKASTAAESFYMSDANLRFVYDASIISFASKTILSHNAFSSSAPANDLGYGAITTQGSQEVGASGVVSLNITYTGSSPSLPPKKITEVFTTIAVLEFNLISTSPTTCFKFTWNNSLTSPTTVINGYDVNETDPLLRAYEATEFNLERLNACLDLGTPVVTATPTLLATGSPINFSASLATTRVGNYKWTGPNSFSSTLQNPTILSATTAATGTYSAIFESNGCISSPGTVSLSVTTSAAPVATNTCTPAAAPTLASNSPVVSGGMINLSATSTSTGGNYVWAGPSGFGSNNQNPSLAAVASASGVYTARYDISSTCTGQTATISVTVTTAPVATNTCTPAVAPTLASNSPVVSGGMINLSATSTRTGGTYVWAGPSGFGSNNQNPSLAAVASASGIYTARYDISSTCTGQTATISVTVTAAPVATNTCTPAVAPTLTSNSPVVSGGMINLSATSTSTGGNYVWAGPSGFGSNNQNPSLAAVASASGIYTARYDVSSTCTGQSATISVTVTTAPVATNTCTPAVAPTLTSNSPVVSGGMINLSATSTSTGGNYVWAGPSGFGSNNQNPSLAAVASASGIYTARYDVSSTCTGQTATISVTVTTAPASTTTIPIATGGKPDLSLNISVSNKKPKVGDVISYTITLKNDGTTLATGIEVTDKIPVQFVELLPSSASNFNPNSGVWSVSSLAANSSTTLVLSAKVIAEGVAYNQVEITKQNETDFDSTPNNGIDAEDDIERVCFSVPMKLCDGDQIIMKIPANYTNIVWYKNGVKLSETGNSLTITQTGSYSYTATNNTCPTDGCCPLEVVFGDCCEVKCIPFVIKRTK